MFTELEKKILDSMDLRYKWIARDKDGTIAVFFSKPGRFGNMFLGNDKNCLPCLSNLFQQVTWEDVPIRFREPILDDKEREYLTAVLKPLPHVNYVRVSKSLMAGREFLEIVFDNDEKLKFPSFISGTMYKKMYVGKRYTLEELGINLK